MSNLDIVIHVLAGLALGVWICAQGARGRARRSLLAADATLILAAISCEAARDIAAAWRGL